MIGNTTPELVFIRLSILLLRSIPLLSFLLLSLNVLDYWRLIYVPAMGGLLAGSVGWLGYALLAYALVEVVFWVICRRRWWNLQAPPIYQPPPMTRAERRKIFEECCHEPTLQDLDPTYPQGWFFPYSRPSPHLTTSSPSKSAFNTRVRRKDVVEWASSVFSLPEPTTTEEAKAYEEEIREYVEWLEGRVGATLADDSVEDEELREERVTGWEKAWWRVWKSKKQTIKNEIRSMRVTHDPITALHRPFVWYMIVALVDTLTSIQLLLLGFRHYTLSNTWFTCFPPRPLLTIPGVSNNTRLMELSKENTSADERKVDEILLPWWYRPHLAGPDEMPVVFLHGIGIGLHPYMAFLRSLPKTTGIIAFELLPISMHMTSSPLPPRPLMVQAIEWVLESVGWDKVVVAGHSYGSFLVGGLVKKMPIPNVVSIEGSKPNEEGRTIPRAPGVEACGSGSSDTRSTDSDVEGDGETQPLPPLLPTSFRPTHLASSTNPAPERFSSSRPSFPSTTPSESPTAFPTHILYPPTLPQTHAQLQNRIAHIILIDPIPILLHLPSIAYNFLYREPKRAAEWQLWYFASRDADVGRQLGRGMWWREGCLGVRELRDVMTRRGLDGGEEGKGRNVAVVLAGEDQIVPSELVRRYLTGEEDAKEYWARKGWGWDRPPAPGSSSEAEGQLVDVDVDQNEEGEMNAANRGGEEREYGDLEVIWTPGIDHATIFDTEERRERVCEILRRYVRDV